MLLRFFAIVALVALSSAAQAAEIARYQGRVPAMGVRLAGEAPAEVQVLVLSYADDEVCSNCRVILCSAELDHCSESGPMASQIEARKRPGGWQIDAELDTLFTSAHLLVRVLDGAVLQIMNGRHRVPSPNTPALK